MATNFIIKRSIEKGVYSPKKMCPPLAVWQGVQKHLESGCYMSKKYTSATLIPEACCTGIGLNLFNKDICKHRNPIQIKNAVWTPAVTCQLESDYMSARNSSVGTCSHNKLINLVPNWSTCCFYSLYFIIFLQC